MRNTLLLFALAFSVATNSFATNHTILVSDDVFTPSSIPTVHLGDTLTWVWQAGTHTTTSTSVPSTATNWNSNINSSTTTFRYIPSVVGTYSYDCTFHASMGMTGSFVVSELAGVNEVKPVSSISVFPNPASQSLHIQLNTSNAAPLVLTLTDLSGSKVMANKYEGVKEMSLELNDIPNGIYVLHAEQGSDIYNEQIVVAH